VSVREYQPGDESACRALFEELLETHRALYPDGSVGGDFAPEGRLFVAEEVGEVVGYAGLISHGDKAELEPIVVAKRHRGTGVGRALVERVVEEARDGGAVCVFACPTARNRDAIAFFHAVGLDGLGYVQVQLDLEPRERHSAERLADRAFRV
jgi:[ribosomal protein S18]-alanine N-acetyltransferase